MYKNEEYWNEFYAKNTNLKVPSGFSQSEYLTNFDVSNYILVELGCGSGADSFYLANQGFEVVAIDGSEAAIENNKQIDDGYVKFLCRDLSDKIEVAKLLSELNAYALQQDKHVIIYTRFFLHAITDAVEDILLEAIIKEINVPLIFVSEFRVKEDEGLYKIYDNHYRRYVDTNAFLNKVMTHGFDITRFEKSRGLAVYKDEDPFIARVMLRKE